MLIAFCLNLEKLTSRERLVRDLFNKYDPYMIPTLTPKKPKSVSVDFSCTYIDVVQTIKIRL